MNERRLLQCAVALACLVPFAAGGAGVIASVAMVKSAGVPSVDLDSHFRYLSGLLFGIGLGFAACIPRIEAKGTLFRGLTLVVVCGGLARLFALVTMGSPSPGHLFGLAMELGVVPALALWQARVAAA
ncbi:DUF4345 domain-containing protein [Sphingosinicella sp. BN140058]|uniref:DUF4345 domain-containing protein n=1 Tax=Sphingosinicella sp. BN140058 TaxID=1892855 RepID=UPI00101272FA|nr:DUF4345 domain-containing protein [Sphingosinicella sp. BN140058]QAY76850.1 DUF4345 domain-containing protein [Sphingosinicella sp. BN140058]